MNATCEHARTGSAGEPFCALAEQTTVALSAAAARERERTEEIRTAARAFVECSGFRFTTEDGGVYKYDYSALRLHDAWVQLWPLLRETSH